MSVRPSPSCSADGAPMQPRPTAEEILRDVAALLDDVLFPRCPDRHSTRRVSRRA